MPLLSSAYVPSPWRMYVIAQMTFVQLMRMKVFLFFLVFAVMAVGLNFIRLGDVVGAEATFGGNELILLKNSCFGAMRLFGIMFSIMAMCLILPKDVEDRTLYTILSKPVARLDYLVGKALGVIALTALSLLLMDALMSAMLYFRTETVLAEQAQLLGKYGYSAELVQQALDRIAQQGVTWSLQAGVAVLLMECIVLTTLALLLSCMTTGTLIAALLTLCLYVTGLFQPQLAYFWTPSGSGSSAQSVTWVGEIAPRLLAMLLPNFNLYSITDAAVNGMTVTLSLLRNLLLITAGYFVFHVLLSAWIFRKKEF